MKGEREIGSLFFGVNGSILVWWWWCTGEGNGERAGRSGVERGRGRNGGKEDERNGRMKRGGVGCEGMYPPRREEDLL